MRPWPRSYPPVTGLELLEPQRGAQAQTTLENQAKLDGLVALHHSPAVLRPHGGGHRHRHLLQHGNRDDLREPA